MLKRTVVLFSVFFSVLFAGFSFASTQSSAPSSLHLNSVIAVVNNEVITQSELNAALTAAKKQLAASANPNAINASQLKKMVLQQLIDEKLQLELAKRADIKVTDAQVTQAIAHIAKNYQMTVSELKGKLQQQGMTYTAYRQMIHKQLLIHQVQQSALNEKINITPADIQAALAAYQSQTKSQQSFHVIDIVSPTKQAAETIIAKLHSGAKISGVAPNNTNDLGWQTANTLPTLFLQQLANMKAGDIAGPIQAPNGYHVIQLAGVHGTASNPSKQQLQNIAYQMKLQKAVETWLKQLQKTAYVKIV